MFQKKVATIIMPMLLLIAAISINAKIVKMEKIFIRHQFVIQKDIKYTN